MNMKLPACMVAAGLAITACSDPRATAVPPAETSSQPAATAAATPAHGSPSTSITAVEVAAQSAAPAVRVFIDPVSGELRAPTVEERAALAAQRDTASAANRAALKQSEPVEEIHLPNGVTEIRLGDKAMRQERVCIRPDGGTARCPSQGP